MADSKKFLEISDIRKGFGEGETRQEVLQGVSFSADKLEENYRTLIDTLNRVRPAAAKGQYMRSITVAATMSPPVPIAV